MKHKNISLLVLLMALPIIVYLVFLSIDLYYKNGALHTSDWSNFFVGVLTYYGTVSLGVLAYYQNDKNRKLQAEKYKAEVTPILSLKHITVELFPWETIAEMDLDEKKSHRKIIRSIDLKSSISYVCFRFELENTSINPIKNFICYESSEIESITGRKNSANELLKVQELSPTDMQEITYYFVFDEIEAYGSHKIMQLNTRICFCDIFGNQYGNDISIQLRYNEETKNLYFEVYFSQRIEVLEPIRKPMYYFISNYMKEDKE